MTEIVIGHLYPDHLNLYGDRGNLQALYQRAAWRGLGIRVQPLGIGSTFDPTSVDILFMGGGQDAQQVRIVADLHETKVDTIREAVLQHGKVMLGICGGFQLMGHYYQPFDGEQLKGLSLVDAVTVAGRERFIGNVVIERPNGQTLVGFENHSGLTTLGEGVTPLGKVLSGRGNNGLDGTEGVCQGTCYGTYLHGALLPKNPALTDELLRQALKAKRMDWPESPRLDDQLEQVAHDRVKHLLGV